MELIAVSRQLSAFSIHLVASLTTNYYSKAYQKVDYQEDC